MPGAHNVCSFVFAVDVHHVLFIGHDAASRALYSGVPYVFVVLHGKILQVSHFTLAFVPTNLQSLHPLTTTVNQF